MSCMLCMSMFASMVNMGVKVLVNRTVDSNGEHGCVMSMCEHGCHELRSNTKTPSVFCESSIRQAPPAMWSTYVCHKYVWTCHKYGQHCMSLVWSA